MKTLVPDTKGQIMTFYEALEILNIEDYAERILNSNSRGELFHLTDYIDLANIAKSLDDEIASTFRAWFEETVKLAEENWKRPESVFQHIPKIIADEH